MVAIAFSLIPSIIISFILKERENQLKHMQMISGVSKCAYWTSNLISDIIKTYIPIGLILALQNIFGISVEDAWVSMLVYPIAIVPFTYVTSFMFTSDSVA